MLLAFTSSQAQTWKDILPASNPSALFGLVVYGQMRDGKAINEIHPSKDKGNENEAWFFSRTGSEITLCAVNMENGGSMKISGTILGNRATFNNGDAYTILAYEDGTLLLLNDLGWYRVFVKIE